MAVYKYVKKPIMVEALQFTGYNFDEVEDFAGDHVERDVIEDFNVYYVRTLEGRMLCVQGSYIVKGPHGEVWPVKKEIFEETYKRVDDDGGETILVHIEPSLLKPLNDEVGKRGVSVSTVINDALRWYLSGHIEGPKMADTIRRVEDLVQQAGRLLDEWSWTSPPSPREETPGPR